MADYTFEGPLQELPEWGLYHLSECLEDHGVRHCIAGDAIIATLGYPLVICDFYLAVADEQLEDALAVVLRQGFQEAPGRDFYVDEHASFTPLGWPGHRLTRTSASPKAPAVVLVPSSFWHVELSEPSLSTNTFLHPTTRCRFPKRLFYLDALIDVIVERASNPGGNKQLSGYFRGQYHYLLACLSPDILRSLPQENEFFVELYGRPLPPSTRREVCLNRQRIRQGLISVDEAWQSISRKALEADNIWRKARNHS